jgi:predicted transcriptional regulator
MFIADIMIKDAQYLLIGQTVEHAAQRMFRHGNTVIPVCRGDGSVCGVVTPFEIVVSIAQGRAAPLCPVEEVMNQEFPSCAADDPASDIQLRMITEAIPALVVLTWRGKLAGLVDRTCLPARARAHARRSGGRSAA